MNKCMHIDVSEKDLKDLSIGDKVTLRVTGTIEAMQAGHGKNMNYKGQEAMPPDIRLDVSKIEIDKPNVFAEMAEDD